MKKSTRKPLRQHALVLLSALTLPFALTGCGGGGSTSAMAVYETAAAAAGTAYMYDNGAYDYDGAERYDMEAAPEAADTSAQEGGPSATTDVTQTIASDPALPLDRKLIRNISLRVETTCFDDLLTSIQAKVAQLEGYIEQSDISGNSITELGRPSKKYASMTLRIPSDRLNTFISYVETDGNVTYRSENVSDVTLQYSDLESRLKTLRMEQERLWELMAKADTTEAIVLLEERLTEVSSEIESIGSKLRHMDNSVTYSSVYLDIAEVDLESPTQPETAWQQIQRGFAQNVNALLDALTAFCIGLLSNSPTYLFLLLLAFLAYRLIRMVLRRRHKESTVSDGTKKRRLTGLLSRRHPDTGAAVDSQDKDAAASPSPEEETKIDP